MRKFDYSGYINHTYFTYKVSNIDGYFYIDWNIKNITDSISKGFLLRETNGCNFVLCDLNFIHNRPILNLVFKPNNIDACSEDKLCFWLKNNKLIELNVSRSKEIKKKICNTYVLTKEVIELLIDNPIIKIGVKSKAGYIYLITRVAGNRPFNVFMEVYNSIIKQCDNNISIPKQHFQVIISDITVESVSNQSEEIPVEQIDSLDIATDLKSKEKSKECFVYLMYDSSTNCYKIGISKRPQYREKTLQSQKPCIDLLFAKSYPSRKLARAFENSLHKAYKEKHVRGEWFSLDKEDVQQLEIVLNN